MQNYQSLLKQRPQFRLLWLAQVISLTGDWFNTIAVVILINRYTDSATAVSILFLTRSLPAFLFGPLAGVVADRFDRKTVLVLSNLLRVLVVLGYLVASDVWMIFALSGLQFFFSAFFEPAYAAILPSLVERDDLLTANTLGSITWSVMLTVGSVIGGLVAAALGVNAALLLDAATFALAAGIIFFIQPQRPTIAASSEHNHFRNFVDGLRYVRRNPEIGLIATVKALAQMGSIDVMIVVYAARVFTVGKEGATTIGLLFAAHGLGAVLGPLLGDYLGDGNEIRLKKWISYGFVLVVAGWFVFGVAWSLPVAFAGMVLRGMGGSINWTYSSVLLQMKVPDQFLGRVFGLDFTIFTLALSVSVWGSGAALDMLHLDPQYMAVYISLLSFLPLVFWSVLSRHPRLAARTGL